MNATAERTATVFVVDDQAPFREAVAAVARAAGMRLVGHAVDGAQALDRLLAMPAPALVLMDVALPDIGGIEVTRRLMACRPELRVLLVSTMSEVDLPSDAANCGAIGFLPKSRIGVDELHRLVVDLPDVPS